MRPASSILIVFGLFWTGWACAQASEGLPKGSLGDAGEAAAYAQFLCNTPGGQIDAFRRKVDTLTAGGTNTAEYHAGEVQARAVIDKVRHTDNGDTRELEAMACPESIGYIQKIVAQP